MHAERWVTSYSFFALAALVLSAVLWGWVIPRDKRGDLRLSLVYLAGIGGAAIGAKLAFLFAEGWHYRDDWLALLTGRSITGGLLGGYAAVEWAKRYLRYCETTGDVFALVVPVAIGMGRIGCFLQGCCAGIATPAAWYAVTDSHGVSRWPAQSAELIFNAMFLLWAFAAQRFAWLPGNRFHIYLMAYGLFRFGNEFVRERVEWVGPFGGYHFVAAGMVAFGVERLAYRMRSREPVNANAVSGAEAVR